MGSIDVAATYKPFGGWMKPPADLQSALEGEETADVIVVGAGYAGLHAALELAARGAKVVVLEKDYAGFGASSRNAGYLAGGQGLEHEMFERRLGTEQARQIVAFYQQGVPFVEGKLAEYGIDCDYVRSGLIRAAIHPSQEKRLRASLEKGNALGAPARFIDRAGLQARGIPEAFLFGYVTENGGTLDPGKYVSGLRNAAIRAGVKLYEGTALVSYTEGATITCHTAKGRVQAPHMIFATNAWTPQLGLLGDKVLPLRVSAIETEPLTTAQLDALGWPNREGITTQHYIMESQRLTARNTIVITTKRLNYVYGSKTPSTPDSKAYNTLFAALNQRFPMLKGIGVNACWSGYITFALDALPVVGDNGGVGNVFYASGCSGHGLGTQSLIGNLIARKIDGEEDPLLCGLRHKTPSLPPEPLRWALASSALGGAHLLDGWDDRRAR